VRGAGTRVVDPILATPPWRSSASRPRVIAETAANLHEHDWAGAGFTKPGLRSDLGYQVGYVSEEAVALADMTTGRTSKDGA
jgi:hypothetical protein